MDLGFTLLKIQCPDAVFDNIRAIFFDKDGTLVQVEPYLRLLSETFMAQLEQSVAGIAAPLRASWGLTAKGLDAKGLMATTSRLTCNRAAVDVLVQEGVLRSQAEQLVASAEAVTERLLPSKAPLTPLVPGIIDLLQHLGQLPVSLGVLTADSTANLEDCLDYYGLRPIMQLALASEPGQLSKPDPDFYRHACARLGLAPEQTLMIGDAESDCRMAKAAGAAAIGVTWAWPSEFSPQFQSADAILTAMSDILPIV